MRSGFKPLLNNEIYTSEVIPAERRELQIPHGMRETILFVVSGACVVTKNDAVTSMKSLINETQRRKRSLCYSY